MMVDSVEAWIWLETVPQRENRTLRDSVVCVWGRRRVSRLRFWVVIVGTFHVFRGVLELPL